MLSRERSELRSPVAHGQVKRERERIANTIDGGPEGRCDELTADSRSDVDNSNGKKEEEEVEGDVGKDENEDDNGNNGKSERDSRDTTFSYTTVDRRRHHLGEANDIDVLRTSVRWRRPSHRDEGIVFRR